MRKVLPGATLAWAVEEGALRKEGWQGCGDINEWHAAVWVKGALGWIQG